MQGTASHDVLLRFCSACFVKLGMPSEDAALTADNLVFASLRGVDSHGVMRMKIYADRMRARGTDPRARPRVLSESAVHVLLDGGDGVGQVATAEAMRRVIAKARDSGLAVGGVRNSNHFGAAAYFAMMALEHGMAAAAPSPQGTLNGKRFESIRDADPEVGPRLELYAAGAYLW
ncbi:MAG: Ldh family oxidoreductase, partial [Acidobacteriia bacterium]|nr:Ldh family oxidoreductase [Terriglobia bacterium]